jgi:hypothetical protein
MGEDALKKIDPSRRSFLKKLIQTAAFASPMLLSFSGTSFGLGQAKASGKDSGGPLPDLHGYGNGYGHYGNHGHGYGGYGNCPGDQGGHATISMTGGGILPGDTSDVHLGFHMSDAQGPDNEIELNWKDAQGEHSFHARCFAVGFDTSNPDYVIVWGPGGGYGQAQGSLDQGGGLLEFGFLAYNNGDAGLGALVVFDDAGNPVFQAYGTLARGALTAHRNK